MLQRCQIWVDLGVGQNLLLSILMGSIYQLFWGSLGARVLTNSHFSLTGGSHHLSTSPSFGGDGNPTWPALPQEGGGHRARALSNSDFFFSQMCHQCHHGVTIVPCQGGWADQAWVHTRCAKTYVWASQQPHHSPHSHWLKTSFRF